MKRSRPTTSGGLATYVPKVWRSFASRCTDKKFPDLDGTTPRSRRLETTLGSDSAESLDGPPGSSEDKAVTRRTHREHRRPRKPAKTHGWPLDADPETEREFWLQFRKNKCTLSLH